MYDHCIALIGVATYGMGVATSCMGVATSCMGVAASSMWVVVASRQAGGGEATALRGQAWPDDPKQQPARGYRHHSCCSWHSMQHGGSGVVVETTKISEAARCRVAVSTFHCTQIIG